MRASQQLQLQTDPADPPRTATRADSSAATIEQRWLAMQCQMLEDIGCGLLFRVSGDLSRARMDATWPRAVATRKGMVRKVLICAQRDKLFLEEVPAASADRPLLRLYKPISAGDLNFVLVLEMGDRSEAERRTVANLLRWNTEWFRFALLAVPQESKRDLASMVSIAVGALDHREFRATATALVTDLASRFLLQRVSLGLRRGKRIEVAVLSHSARFKHESNLIQAIGAAMDEAADQDRTISYPPTEQNATAIRHAHEQLAKGSAGSVASIPFSDGDSVIGALTLERETGPPLDASELAQIEQLLALLAPTLWLRRESEKSLLSKAWQSLKGFIGRLFGHAHIGLKLGVLAGVLIALFCYFAKGDWRVTADAVIEGSVQRTIAAPIDGYIASADVRPGDVVESGELMGALDDNDLRLERLKWTTRRQQLVSELREARAENDRAEVSIITAKIEQANAELQLVDEKLSRTQLTAPFDGIVIDGDLSQRLGTPVKRGDQLFRVAPLDGFRIVLRVDEQDIAPVEPGMTGRLVLASMPDRAVDLEVTRVTPVSTPGQGRNYFRVEAVPRGATPALQPGLEGIGKIRVGEARLIWIWTRELMAWLRLQTWTWWR